MAYKEISVEMWMLSLLCLIAIGFMTYGPHVFIVASAPVDYGTSKAVSSATGFIDGRFSCGYAPLGILMLALWIYKPEKRTYP